MQNDFFERVYFIGNGTVDHDEAFIHYNHDLYKIIQWRYTDKCRFYVPNPWGMYDQPISDPQHILDDLAAYLEE